MLDVNKFSEHSKTHHTDNKTFFFDYSKSHAKDLERSSDRWPVWRSLFCMKLRETGKTSLCPCCAFCSSQSMHLYLFLFIWFVGSSTGNNLVSSHIGAWAIEGVLCDLVCWKRQQACRMNDCEGAKQQHQLARIPLEPDWSRTTAVEFLGQYSNIH